jgi:hypothetical protein
MSRLCSDVAGARGSRRAGTVPLLVALSIAASTTFNPGEKKGAAQVEFSPVMPGAATAQAKAYNAHISKLNLARRFPLNKVVLTKCAAGAPAR